MWNRKEHYAYNELFSFAGQHVRHRFDFLLRSRWNQEVFNYMFLIINYIDIVLII